MIGINIELDKADELTAIRARVKELAAFADRVKIEQGSGEE
jgi:hypothetical protein